MSQEKEGIRQVNPEELLKIYENGGEHVTLVDVRTPEEFVAGHIPGIEWIPMDQIPREMNQLDREKEYIFVCRSGNRSQKVCLFLKENGFERVANFSGGMLGWTGPVKEGMEK
ncbi:MAG: rhodanese-like domain-containing protein [Bacillaceae bacterium]|nr:rhodanese-like domain-containing protein [Bacillaceae bacterium]